MVLLRGFPRGTIQYVYMTQTLPLPCILLSFKNRVARQLEWQSIYLQNDFWFCSELHLEPAALRIIQYMGQTHINVFLSLWWTVKSQHLFLSLKVIHRLHQIPTCLETSPMQQALESLKYCCHSLTCIKLTKLPGVLATSCPPSPINFISLI